MYYVSGQHLADRNSALGPLRKCEETLLNELGVTSSVFNARIGNRRLETFGEQGRLSIADFSSTDVCGIFLCNSAAEPSTSRVQHKRRRKCNPTHHRAINVGSHQIRSDSALSRCRSLVSENTGIKKACGHATMRRKHVPNAGTSRGDAGCRRASCLRYERPQRRRLLHSRCDTCDSKPWRGRLMETKGIQSTTNMGHHDIHQRIF